MIEETLEQAPRLGVQDYVTRLPNAGRAADWRDVGSVPRAGKRFRPQGLAWADGGLWLSDHRRNATSHLYRVDVEDAGASFDARMPAGALHPGGLTVHDGQLWALDYVSTQLYAIDPQATLDEQRVVIEATYPTGLGAASALAHLEVDGVDLLAFSDFLWRMQTTPPRPEGSARTYLVPLDRVEELDGCTVPDLSVCSYDNGGFSQGLAWDGDVLLEACNNVGVDRVEVLDIREAVREGDGQLVQRRGSFAGPAHMIEDLATDGNRLWTTDEGTFRLYERARIERDPQHADAGEDPR